MTAVTAKPKAEHFEHLAYYEVKPEKSRNRTSPSIPTRISQRKKWRPQWACMACSMYAKFARCTRSGLGRASKETSWKPLPDLSIC